MKRLLGFIATVASAALFLVACSNQSSDDGTDRRSGPAPLFSGLGDYEKPVSTDSELAQRYFNQGMMFVYGFNHKEAIRSFEAAATVDPKLAIAWWGASFAHGPNINAAMESDAVSPAIEALRKAQSLAEGASDWERGYIEALAERYSDNPDADQTALNTKYAEAMRKLSKAYPDDLDAATLFADSMMNTMAWDYWLADKKTPKPATMEVMTLLESVIERSPDHPGANHALIHIVEAGPEPQRGLHSAESLRFYAPDAGHLVHMPAHIFMRVGQYHEAVLANERAAESDWKYISQCNAQGFYPGLYYPHNEHFLWWALTFEGQQKYAMEKATEIAELAGSPICGIPVLEKPRFTHLPLITAVRFSDWAHVMDTPEPEESEALDRVMWHWARATAYAGMEDSDGAVYHAKATREIANSQAVADMENVSLPTTVIARIAANLAEGRAHAAFGDNFEAIVSYERAVDAEDSMPYMEPAFWFYPTRQTLGAALLAVGRSEEAEMSFREDLVVWPLNGWSLYGLAASLDEQGRKDEAAVVQSEFDEAWQYADTMPELKAF